MGTAYKCDDCGILMEDIWPQLQDAEFGNGLKIIISRSHPHQSREHAQCPKCAIESLAAALHKMLNAFQFEQLQRDMASVLIPVKWGGKK